jgi:hypothetical protein
MKPHYVEGHLQTRQHLNSVDSCTPWYVFLFGRVFHLTHLLQLRPYVFLGAAKAFRLVVLLRRRFGLGVF